MKRFVGAGLASVATIVALASGRWPELEWLFPTALLFWLLGIVSEFIAAGKRQGMALFVATIGLLFVTQALGQEWFENRVSKCLPDYSRYVDMAPDEQDRRIKEWSSPCPAPLEVTRVRAYGIDGLSVQPEYSPRTRLLYLEELPPADARFQGRCLRPMRNDWYRGTACQSVLPLSSPP